MNKVAQRQTICFAYFADGIFLGWYADSFGSIRPYPKLYGYSEEQIKIITSNFRSKLEDVKEKTVGFPEGHPALVVLNKSKYNHVELRVVECLEYDGPNPDYDAEEYGLILEEYNSRLAKERFKMSENFCNETVEYFEKWKIENPKPQRNSWICADYEKVKEWAVFEPTEFIEIILPI